MNGAVSYILAAAGPIIVGLSAYLRSRLRRQGLGVIDALMWPFSKRIRTTVTSLVNLRRYCRLALAAPGTQTLHVPGSRETTTLQTDDAFISLRLESATSGRRTFSNESVLDAGRRIQIIGDPGSGKSSLV